MIVFTLLPDGGFVCGDTESRQTSYAYPTSTHATSAKRHPSQVAYQMVRAANKASAWVPVAIAEPYNAGNWARLPA